MKLLLWIHESKLEALNLHFRRVGFPIHMDSIEKLKVSCNQIGNHWVQFSISYSDYVAMIDKGMIELV